MEACLAGAGHDYAFTLIDIRLDARDSAKGGRR